MSTTTSLVHRIPQAASTVRTIWDDSTRPVTSEAEVCTLAAASLLRTTEAQASAVRAAMETGSLRTVLLHSGRAALFATVDTLSPFWVRLHLRTLVGSREERRHIFRGITDAGGVLAKSVLALAESPR